MFAERLKKLRIDEGLSLKDVSEVLGVTPMTLSRYENGYREPDFETLEKLSSYFDVRTDWILGISDDKTNLDYLVSMDFENLSKMYNSARNNEEMKRLVSLLVEKIFLICNEDVVYGNLEQVEWFSTILRDIWATQECLPRDAVEWDDKSEPTAQDKLRWHLERKERINMLLDRMFFDSFDRRG